MKKRSFSRLTTALAAIAMLVTSVAMTGTANADLTFGVNGSEAAWEGFMNVYELDDPFGAQTQGAFVFGSGWGVPDLTADINDGASTITLGPNTVGDPDPFWYLPDGGPGAQGNKWMEANLFQNFNIGDAGAEGMNITFEGSVDSYTFTAAHTLDVFVKEFDAGFGLIGETLVSVGGPGAFSVSQALVGDSTGFFQFGFQVNGQNVWVTDVAPFGTAVVNYKAPAIPEPTSLAFLGLGAIGLISRRRR